MISDLGKGGDEGRTARMWHGDIDHMTGSQPHRRGDVKSALIKLGFNLTISLPQHLLDDETPGAVGHKQKVAVVAKLRFQPGPQILCSYRDATALPDLRRIGEGDHIHVDTGTLQDPFGNTAPGSAAITEYPVHENHQTTRCHRLVFPARLVHDPVFAGTGPKRLTHPPGPLHF